MKRKKLVSLILAVLTALTVSACSKDGTHADSDVQFIALEIGQQVYIPADDEAAWKSGDPSVVTTSTTDCGYVVVTGVAAGTAYVTASGEKTSYRVTVGEPHVTPFNIDNGYNIFIDFEDFDAVSATQIVIDGKTEWDMAYTFETADRRIASVDESGVIHAWRKGVTVITVTQSDGAYRKINVIVAGKRSSDFYVKELYSGLSGTGQHVQSSVCDPRGEIFVHSYTDRLIVQHRDGTILGTVIGFVGHTGDLVYDEERDLYYVSFAPNRAGHNCYALVVDVNKITRIGMTPAEAGIEIVYVGEPIYKLAKTEGYGTGPYDRDLNLGGKFGVTNTVDSLALGPIPGSNDGKRYLSFGGGFAGWTTKYGKTVIDESGETVTVPVYPCDREDNDYLCVMQYDVDEFLSYAVPFADMDEADGPKEFANVFFFYMGAHDYGIQVLAYDEEENVYFVSCYSISNAVEVYEKGTDKRLYNVDYQGTTVPNASVLAGCVPYDSSIHDVRPAGVQFPKYPFFVIDASKVEKKKLIGNNGYVGNVVEGKYGKKDEATGIRGFTNGFGDTGIFAVPGGYMYRNISVGGTSANNYQTSSYTRLFRWNITNPNSEYIAGVLVQV